LSPERWIVVDGAGPTTVASLGRASVDAVVVAEDHGWGAQLRGGSPRDP